MSWWWALRARGKRWMGRHVCSRVGHRWSGWFDYARMCRACGLLLRAPAEFRHESPGVMQQGADGRWGPAVPLPLYVGYRGQRYRCGCGMEFSSQDLYEFHWRLHNEEGR